MYSSIAKHFDETRHKPWPGIVQFLNTLKPDTQVLDLGCGNGKYLGVRSDLNFFACDICPELIQIAQSKHPNISFLVCDGCSLPYKSESMDAVYSIAVFHHLKTVQERQAFLKEVHRVLKHDGQFFLTVWSPAAVQMKWIPLGPGDFSVPWRDKYTQTTFQRYYHIFEESEILRLLEPMFEIRIWEECQNWYIQCQKKRYPE
jgi:ubiquinone/menaquinone biosynthesis C-methylase UbiE